MHRLTAECEFNKFFPNLVISGYARKNWRLLTEANSSVPLIVEYYSIPELPDTVSRWVKGPWHKGLQINRNLQ